MITKKLSLFLLLLNFYATVSSNNPDITIIQNMAKKGSVGSFSLGAVTGAPGIFCRVAQLHFSSLGNFFISQKLGSLAISSFSVAKSLFGASLGCTALWAFTKSLEKAQQLDALDCQKQAQNNSNYWLNKRLNTASSLHNLQHDIHSFLS